MTTSQEIQLTVLTRQVKEYRQALWDIYGILGFDQDGDRTPDALTFPSLITLVTEAAREFRADYDEAIS